MSVSRGTWNCCGTGARQGREAEALDGFSRPAARRAQAPLGTRQRRSRGGRRGFKDSSGGDHELGKGAGGQSRHVLSGTVT